jgi:hypothetical protein
VFQPFPESACSVSAGENAVPRYTHVAVDLGLHLNDDT